MFCTGPLLLLLQQHQPLLQLGSAARIHSHCWPSWRAAAAPCAAGRCGTSNTTRSRCSSCTLAGTLHIFCTGLLLLLRTAAASSWRAAAAPCAALHCSHTAQSR
jgi:hypothetical protein